MTNDPTARAYITGSYGSSPGGSTTKICLRETGVQQGTKGLGPRDMVNRNTPCAPSYLPTDSLSLSKWIQLQQEVSLRRSRRRLFRKIQFSGDVTFKFITLTYKTEPTTRAQIGRDIFNMCRRYYSHTGENLKYIKSIDYGARNGRVHIHALIIAPYLDQAIWQDQIWQLGYVDIRKVDKIDSFTSLSKMVAYIAKYLNKDRMDHAPGEHRWDCSGNYPDTARRFRIFFNTYDEAEDSVNLVIEQEASRLETYEMELDTGERIIILDCYSNTKVEENPLYGMLAFLANARDGLFV